MIASKFPFATSPINSHLEDPGRMIHLRYAMKQSVWARAALLASISLLIGACGQLSKAEAAADDYGIESVSASLSTLEAGRHPDVVTEINFKPSGTPVATTESLGIDFPAGLLANPEKFPSCALVTFSNSFVTPCPQDAQIGVVEVRFAGNANIIREPLYILEAPEDEVVRLGFFGLLFPYYLEVDLRSESDYGVTITSNNIPTEGPPQTPVLIRAKSWGVPKEAIHDSERLNPGESFICSEFGIVDGTPCLASCPYDEGTNGKPVFVRCFENGFFPETGKSRSSNLPLQPFMTNPADCRPMDFHFRTTAYQLPGQVFTAPASAGEITDCEKVPFDPSLSIVPTSRRAGSPTGLVATLSLPQNEAINIPNSSPLKGAKVTLPAGFTVNSSAADGLKSCSAEQAAFATRDPAGCPDASRLGTAEFTSSALKRPIEGGIFLRTPEPGHLFRFWLVSNELGVNLKVPAEVELDPSSGRITTVVQESPQLPAEEVVLRLNGGPRAPLRNPETCGTSDAIYEFQPWSGAAAAAGIVPIAITEGCANGKFDPKLSAGTVSPSAGGFSPFVFDVMREDGEQDISRINLELPTGLTAKLAGVPLCPEAAAATAACPAASQIGVVQAAVGAGTQPLWIPQPGKSPTAVYLAGPYGGAPYSVIATVPAQAGPFDLGMVSVRSGIYVDPVTARVTVKSDPLPQILQGIPIDYRHARVVVDRDQFTLNPTSCAVKEVRSTIISIAGTTANPQDRFQAADCASLRFAPRLKLKLKGGTKRGAHPRLQAVLQARPGEANIRKVSVALPHSEFLEQAHIRTVCTRVQFAADTCPNGSIYGHASVTTPLLDERLTGPVYLRSSSNDLPDLVVDLKGKLRITLAGRIDSVNGGIRTTFSAAPDAPIRRFVLNMKGGKQGLLVNSTNLCSSRHFATVKMDGHNGMASNSHPVLLSGC